MKGIFDSWKVWFINILIAVICYYGITLLDGSEFEFTTNYLFKVAIMFIYMQLTGFINLDIKFSGKSYKFSLRNFLENYVLKVDSNTHVFRDLENDFKDHIKIYRIFVYISCIVMLAYFVTLLILVLYPTVTYQTLAKVIVVYIVIATILQLISTLLSLFESLIKSDKI